MLTIFKYFVLFFFGCVLQSGDSQSQVSRSPVTMATEPPVLPGLTKSPRVSLENLMRSQVPSGSLLKGPPLPGSSSVGIFGAPGASISNNAGGQEGSAVKEDADVIVLSDNSTDSPLKSPATMSNTPLFASFLEKAPPSAAPLGSMGVAKSGILSTHSGAPSTTSTPTAPTKSVKIRGLLQAVKKLKPIGPAGESEFSQDEAMSSALSDDDSEAPLPSATDDNDADQSESSSSSSTSSSSDSSSQSGSDDGDDDDDESEESENDEDDDNDQENEEESDGDNDKNVDRKHDVGKTKGKRSSGDETGAVDDDGSSSDDDDDSNDDNSEMTSQSQKTQKTKQPGVKLKLKPAPTTEDDEDGETSDNDDEIDLVSSDDADDDDNDNDKDDDYHASEDEADDDVIMISDDEYAPKGKAIIPSPPRDFMETGTEVLVRDVPNFDPIISSIMASDLNVHASPNYMYSEMGANGK